MNDYPVLLDAVAVAPFMRRDSIVVQHAILGGDVPICGARLRSSGRRVMATKPVAVECRSCRRSLVRRGLLVETTDVDAFWSYFNVADELDGGLTLDDLDASFVREARAGSILFALPWTPSLADAEEYLLDHRAELAAPRHDAVEVVR